MPKKLGLPIDALYGRAVLAGFYIALAGAVSTILGVGFPPNVSRLISACVFPIGLIFVVLTNSELFTGDILTTGSRKPANSFLFAVYIFNWFGTILAAQVFYWAGLYKSFNNQLGINMINLIQNKMTMPWYHLFYSGILCNILVCLSILLSQKTDDDFKKIIFIFIPIFTFVACGFEHIVADMYYFTAALHCLKDKSIVEASGLTADDVNSFMTVPNVLKYFIWISAGNIVGGLLDIIFIELSRVRKTDS